VDCCAEGEGVLEEEEVADVAERGLGWSELAFEGGEGVEGGGLGYGRDTRRISALCGASVGVRGTGAADWVGPSALGFSVHGT